jgi:hypothetical protein
MPPDASETFHPVIPPDRNSSVPTRQVAPATRGSPDHEGPTMPSRDRWIPLGGAVRPACLVRTAPHAASVRLRHSHLLPMRVLPPRCNAQRAPGTLVVPGAHSHARGHKGRAGKARKLGPELRTADTVQIQRGVNRGSLVPLLRTSEQILLQLAIDSRWNGCRVGAKGQPATLSGRAVCIARCGLWTWRPPSSASGAAMSCTRCHHD